MYGLDLTSTSWGTQSSLYCNTNYQLYWALPYICMFFVQFNSAQTSPQPHTFISHTWTWTHRHISLPLWRTGVLSAWHPRQFWHKRLPLIVFTFLTFALLMGQSNKSCSSGLTICRTGQWRSGGTCPTPSSRGRTGRPAMTAATSGTSTIRRCAKSLLFATSEPLFFVAVRLCGSGCNPWTKYIKRHQTLIVVFTGV